MLSIRFNFWGHLAVQNALRYGIYGTEIQTRFGQ